MKKNAYYQELFARPNMLKKFILNIFLALSYYFRIPIEILIRRDFGERYFSLFLSVIIGIVLIAYPYMFASTPYDTDWGLLTQRFGTWYVYTGIYCYCVYRRWQEIRREPSVFDFARFSLSNGKFHPAIKMLENVSGRLFNPRVTETVIEPGAFLILGVILSAFGQPLGILLIACAVVYSLGYMAAYEIGDNFIMDHIDDILCNENLAATFINDVPSPEGIPVYGQRPSSEEMRERLFRSFQGDSNGDEEATPAR